MTALDAVPVPAEGVTMGVEEELQLVDRRTGALVSRAAQVRASLGDVDPRYGEVIGELTFSQVECVTAVCASLDDVDAAVRHLRRAVVLAAAEHDCAPMSVSLPPIGDWRAQTADVARYADLAAARGHLVSEQLIAGLHVHVGVPSRDRAVAVVDRIRIWMPVLTALSASSPFWAGRDTGFASWRTIHWRRWPGAGPAPRAGDAAGWDAAVDRWLASGVVSLPSQIYWEIRLSPRFPTVEVRAADACPRVEDTVAFAGLVRAMVRAALADLDDGLPAPEPDEEILRAAGWQAARDGIEGTLLDPSTLLPRPAAAVVGDLLAWVDPYVDAADRDRVLGHVRTLLTDGTAAMRMRAAFLEGGLRAAVDLMLGETAAGLGVEGVRAGARRATLAATAAAGTGRSARDAEILADRPPHH